MSSPMDNLVELASSTFGRGRKDKVSSPFWTIMMVVFPGVTAGAMMSSSAGDTLS